MKVNLWCVLNKLVIVYSIKLHSKQKGNLKVISHYIVSCARIIFFMSADLIKCIATIP